MYDCHSKLSCVSICKYERMHMQIRMKYETIQAILTNSLFIARQNSPITSIDTEFILRSWKEICQQPSPDWLRRNDMNFLFRNMLFSWVVQKFVWQINIKPYLFRRCTQLYVKSWVVYDEKFPPQPKPASGLTLGLTLPLTLHWPLPLLLTLTLGVCRPLKKFLNCS